MIRKDDVRCFETFTADLEAIADWLERCGVETVAMESTGVYWIPLYELLEQRGFEVLLINPADFKKFRRKTDVSDCQWLQTLHTFGLLQGSFRPHEKIVTLRSYLRHRDNLVKCASGRGAADAKGVGADEREADGGAQRHHGGDGDGDHPGDLGGRTESAAVGPTCGTSGAGTMWRRSPWRCRGIGGRSICLPCVKGWSCTRCICRSWRELDEQIEAYLQTFEDRSEGQKNWAAPSEAGLGAAS